METHGFSLLFHEKTWIFMISQWGKSGKFEVKVGVRYQLANIAVSSMAAMAAI